MAIIINNQDLCRVKCDSVIANTNNPIRNSAVNSYLRANASLATTAKDVVEAVNEIYGKLAGLAGTVKVTVATAKPDITTVYTPSMWYVGSASPYHIWLYTKDSTDTTIETDLGTTTVDLSDYQKKSVTITGFSGTTVEGILAEIATKFIETAKIKTAKDSSATDSDVYSAKYINDKIVDNAGSDKKISLKYLQDKNISVVDEEGNSVYLASYRVGDVFETLDSTMTAAKMIERFGGTWEALSDREEYNDNRITFSANTGTLGTCLSTYVGNGMWAIKGNGIYSGTLSSGLLAFGKVYVDGTQDTSSNKISGQSCSASYGGGWKDMALLINEGKIWKSGETDGWSGGTAWRFSGIIQVKNITADRTYKRFKRTA